MAVQTEPSLDKVPLLHVHESSVHTRLRPAGRTRSLSLSIQGVTFKAASHRLVHIVAAFQEGKNGVCKVSGGLGLELNSFTCILLVNTNLDSRSKRTDN